MSLAQIPRGQKVIILSLNMPEISAERLTALGLVPGVCVRVVDNSITDISLIECRGARLALGRGLAHLIDVK